MNILFMSCLTSRKDVNLVSCQVDTCSIASSVRLNILTISFFDQVDISDRDQNINMSCTELFSDQTKIQIINHTAHLH